MPIKRHNSEKKLEQLLRDGKLTPASLAHAFVGHDGWCAIHSGGYCNCDSEIIIRPDDEQRREAD